MTLDAESAAGYGAFFFNDTATTEIYTLSLHDALPISGGPRTIAAQIDNQSTLTIADTQGLTLGRAGAVSTDRESIRLNPRHDPLYQAGATPDNSNTDPSPIRSGARRPAARRALD